MRHVLPLSQIQTVDLPAWQVDDLVVVAARIEITLQGSTVNGRTLQPVSRGQGEAIRAVVYEQKETTVDWRIKRRRLPINSVETPWAWGG